MGVNSLINQPSNYSLFTYKNKIKIQIISYNVLLSLSFLSLLSLLSLFFLSLHFPFHIHNFSTWISTNSFFFGFDSEYCFCWKRITVLSYDVVFERSKSEKNEATLTPSRTHVISGGGEGVCAVTDEEKTTVPLTETSEEGGANEIAFFFCRRVFSWWWCKRSGS